MRSFSHRDSNASLKQAEADDCGDNCKFKALAFNWAVLFGMVLTTLILLMPICLCDDPYTPLFDVSELLYAKPMPEQSAERFGAWLFYLALGAQVVVLALQLYMTKHDSKRFFCETGKLYVKLKFVLGTLAWITATAALVQLDGLAFSNFVGSPLHVYDGTVSNASSFSNASDASANVSSVVDVDVSVIAASSKAAASKSCTRLDWPCLETICSSVTVESTTYRGCWAHDMDCSDGSDIYDVIPLLPEGEGCLYSYCPMLWDMGLGCGESCLRYREREVTRIYSRQQWLCDHLSKNELCPTRDKAGSMVVPAPVFVNGSFSDVSRGSVVLGMFMDDYRKGWVVPLMYVFKIPSICFECKSNNPDFQRKAGHFLVNSYVDSLHSKRKPKKKEEIVVRNLCRENQMFELQSQLLLRKLGTHRLLLYRDDGFCLRITYVFHRWASVRTHVHVNDNHRGGRVLAVQLRCATE